MRQSTAQLLTDLPSSAIQFMNAKNWGGDLQVSYEPYYSKIRFSPTTAVDGSNNVTYTFAANQNAQPFMYGLNGSLAAAGFGTLASYLLATASETNLQNSTGRQTNDGALMVIDGISCLLSPTSDPIMAMKLLPELHVSCGFGANFTNIKLGNPLMLPGGGGLAGAGFSPGIMPNNADTQAVLAGFPANGLPGEGNIRNLSDPIVWLPPGQQDGMFGMQVTCARALSYVASARVAGTGIVAILPPSTQGAASTYVEMFIRLHGVQLRPRSVNA